MGASGATSFLNTCLDEQQRGKRDKWCLKAVNSQRTIMQLVSLLQVLFCIVWKFRISLVQLSVHYGMYCRTCEVFALYVLVDTLVRNTIWQFGLVEKKVSFPGRYTC